MHGIVLSRRRIAVIDARPAIRVKRATDRWPGSPVEAPRGLPRARPSSDKHNAASFRSCDDIIDFRPPKSFPPSASGSPAIRSSRSTRSFCARRRSGPSSASPSSRARTRRSSSTRWRRASILTPLFDLMRNEAVLKVYHAARQDIEIVWHLAKFVPHPVFDTQVAAMVLGYGDSIAYDQLVQRLTGAHIDKSSRFTDWSRRPLTRGAARLCDLGRDLSARRLQASSTLSSKSAAGRTGWRTRWRC